MKVDPNSFSSGQISSKIWMCEEMEKLFPRIPAIWIYGGWYGLASFILHTRGRIDIDSIYSYDADPACRPVADAMNENWVWKNWKFKAFTIDCNYLEPYVYHPDCIINTATEHFDSDMWFHKIPKGTIVVLQSNNMPHEDHQFCVNSLDEFKSKYKLSELLYEGTLDFNYPSWSFTRFMLIGYK